MIQLIIHLKKYVKIFLNKIHSTKFEIYFFKEWNTRLLIEQSKAIKCPTINFHLAGAKIIQQTLFEPETVEKYIANAEKSAQIRSIFVDQYSFGVNRL